MPRKQEIFANKPKSKHFKLHFSIYNSIAFAGEKPSQNSHRFVFASLRGREPSQTPKFLSPEPLHSLAGATSKYNIKLEPHTKGLHTNKQTSNQMMFALNFMAVRLSQKFSLSNFLIHNKATGRNICRVNAPNNEFPLRGNIGGGAGGRTNLANIVCQILRQLERGSFSRL